MHPRAAIILGGMGDIGRAIATRLAEQGYVVCLLVHTTPEETVNDFIATLPGSGHIYRVCDSTNAVAMKETLQQITIEMPYIEVCIHAAVEPIIRKKIMQFSEAELRSQFEVTVFGGFNFLQQFAQHFVKMKKGTVIGITSAALHDPKDTSAMSGYIVAKYALEGVLRELSREIGGASIGVCAVAPVFVPTQLHKDIPEPVRNFIIERGVTTTPEAVADMVHEVCQKSPQEINGMSFPVGQGVPVKL